MAPDPKVINSIVMPDAALGALASGAPWTDQAVIAVAIALAESGGKPGAVGHNTNGSSDWGLWQINDHAHPGLLDGAAWADPVQNLSMAFTVWQQAGGKWDPWSSYGSGRYQMYMNRATTAVANQDQGVFTAWRTDYNNKVYVANGLPVPTSDPHLGIGGKVASTTYTGLGDIVALVGKIFDPKTWVSVAFLGAGGVMLLLVGWQLLKSNSAVKNVTSTVKSGVKVVT